MHTSQKGMPPNQKLSGSGFLSHMLGQLSETTSKGFNARFFPAWVLKQPMKGLVPNLGDGARNKSCLMHTPEETLQCTTLRIHHMQKLHPSK